MVDGVFSVPLSPPPLPLLFPLLIVVVGNDVGDVVGNDVGDVVGNDVGDVVGNDVGDVVGNDVGDVVGNDVGYVVGNDVGDVVGNDVGDVVGSLLLSPPLLPLLFPSLFGVVGNIGDNVVVPLLFMLHFSVLQWHKVI